MDFRARAAGTGIAHHPKIVGLAAIENVNSRVELGFTKKTGPMLICFLIKLARFADVGFVNGGVKALRRKFPALDE